MNRFVRKAQFILLSTSFIVALSTTAFSQTSRERNTKKAREAASQSDKAARIFSQIMATREKSIPHDLLDRAEAVAVFPSVWKGGFIVGGRGGSGGISRRVAGGWSAPAVFHLCGGGTCLEIRGALDDFNLLFLNQRAGGSLFERKIVNCGE